MNCYDQDDPGQEIGKKAISFLGALQGVASEMNKT